MGGTASFSLGWSRDVAVLSFSVLAGFCAHRKSRLKALPLATRGIFLIGSIFRRFDSQMPEQPFVLTPNIPTSVTALWSFKCTKISCDRSSETLRWVCCSGPVPRTGRIRLLEQLEQISLHARTRYQRYLSYHSARCGLSSSRPRRDTLLSKWCDLAAPLQGPEFWRVVIEDPARRQKNVTLLWKVRAIPFRFDPKPNASSGSSADARKQRLKSQFVLILRKAWNQRLQVRMGVSVQLPSSADYELWAECATDCQSAACSNSTATVRQLGSAAPKG